MVAGCAEGPPEDVAGDDSAILSMNGLTAINGLSSANGLSSVNGLSSANGLSSVNGLSSTSGLMTTAAGRDTVSYIVRCALPAGATLVKKDQDGVSYSFEGALGFAPGWQNGACDTNCQEMVSACLMAHINTAGVHIPLWIVAQSPSVGWALDPSYPNQEGSFFGNIFVPGAHGSDPSKVPAYYCNGKAFNVDVVPGRIGANQVGAPYLNPFIAGPYATSKTGYCSDFCAGSDTPHMGSGYKACGGWNNVVTVYRQAITATTTTTTTTSTTTTTATPHKRAPTR
jgi:hypothetical protein